MQDDARLDEELFLKPSLMDDLGEAIEDVSEMLRDQCRATFLHPDGREERTQYGVVVVDDCGIVEVEAAEVPDWAGDRGVEVVVADRRGDVETAFAIGGFRFRDGVGQFKP